MREFELIRWIRGQIKTDPLAVPVGPGDDCAVVALGGERLLVTTDQVLDGVHFILEKHGPAAAGRKAMARNLSDLAAMAGEPVAAVVSVAMPKGFSSRQAKAIYRGLTGIGDEFGCPLVGGDISTWAGKLAISVTALGRPASGGPVLRSGAKAGDSICVTGRLGGAWKTRRHLEFIPRIAEARAIASVCELHAMIDISDGLAADLGHICEESGVGAELLAAEIPVHPSAQGLQAALNDGEDYELVFTLAEKEVAILRRLKLGVPVTRIGTVVRGKNLTLVHADGRRGKLRPRGWEHSTR